MEASELRIGNLLFFENEVQEVSSIHSDNTIRLRKSKECNCHGCYHINNAIIQPIPLTEEWLLNFGLNKPTNEQPYHFKKSMVEFLHNEYQDNLKCFYNDVPMFSSPCKYVHQLQNLYFALTGKELTIKK